MAEPEANDRIGVEVAYADPQRQILRKVELPSGATAADAIAVSKLAEEVSGIDTMKLGIFSKPVSAQTVLRDGDRVEIYRPLKADPKESRRRRAERR